MTQEQSKILSKLIDASWEKDQTSNSYAARDQYREQYYALKRQLIDSMGEDEFIEFMDKGNRMFAPRK
jgi:hypothetical protein